MSNTAGYRVCGARGGARALCVAALLLCASEGYAQQLDAILKRGKVIVGIDLASPPFGFQDEKRQPAGSEVESAQLLAKDLGVMLEIVPVTGANRIPYLVTGRVDLVMATFAVSPDRAKSVWFSTPYGATGSVVMAAKDVAVKTYADLDRKRVAVARGPFSEQALQREARPTTRIMRFDDDAAATTAMVTGQADAYATAVPIANMLIGRNPRWEIKFSMLRSWYSVGMRRGDVDLLQWVNTFILFHLQNGDLGRIYQKWVGSPLPTVPVL